jgi:hypothetical protein
VHAGCAGVKRPSSIAGREKFARRVVDVRSGRGRVKDYV